MNIVSSLSWIVVAELKTDWLSSSLTCELVLVIIMVGICMVVES